MKPTNPIKLSKLAVFMLAALGLAQAVLVNAQKITIAPETGQILRFGIDAERLWFWRQNIGDQLADVGVGELKSAFVRVAINCAYEREEGVKNPDAYKTIIDMMNAMKKASPGIKFFASPRPLKEAYTKAEAQAIFGKDQAPWGPYPGWIMGLKEFGTDKFDVEKLARYFADYLNLMHEHGFDIDYMDITNEKQLATAAEMFYLHTTLPKLLKKGVKMPLLIAPSTWNWQQGTGFLESLDLKQGHDKGFDIAATHNTGSGGSPEEFAEAARGLNKEAWNTEMHGWIGLVHIDDIKNSAVFWRHIRAGFSGFDTWLFYGTIKPREHPMVGSDGRSIVRTTKYEIYKKVVNAVNLGNYVHSTSSDPALMATTMKKGGQMLVSILNTSEGDIGNATVELPAGWTFASDVASTFWDANTPSTGSDSTIKPGLNSFSFNSPANSLLCFLFNILNGSITSPLAATGMAGVNFTYQVTADNSPASYAIAGGTLPAGVTLDPATGVISGTPTAPGTYNVTLTAIASDGTVGPASTITLSIAPLAVPIITSAPNASGMVGVPFNFQVTAANTPIFSADGLPPGLDLDPDTGVISGTPTSPGSYIVTLTTTNSVATARQQLLMAIDAKTALVTIAGSAGITGSANGSALDARFNAPTGIVADAKGNLYIADTGNNVIRCIAPDGQVTTLADGFSAPFGLAISPGGSILYVADTGNDAIRAIDLATGQITTVSVTGLVAPFGLALDPAGNLYIANTGADTIIQIAADTGAQTTFAGIEGLDGALNLPTGLAISPDGATLYIADTGNSIIRAIDLHNRQVATIAGSAQQPGSTDGPAADARFNTPQALAVDAVGNVYVADTGNHTIRKITAGTNTVTTIAGTAGVAGPDNGSGSQARFNAPAGITIDTAGDIYIADTQNNTIRILQMGPSIHMQPMSQTVDAGAPASFTVVASGAPYPVYQWTHNSTALVGGAEATYSIAAAGVADSGTYAVTLTNIMGIVTSAPATLAVGSSPSSETPSTHSCPGGGGGASSWLLLGAIAALAAARTLAKRRSGMRARISSCAHLHSACRHGRHSIHWKQEN